MLLEKTLESITKLDEEAMEFAFKRQENLLKPPGSLGVMEDLSIKLAGIYGQHFFDTEAKVVLAYAGDHGVHEEGISVQPQSVTADHFPNYVNGGCSIGIISKQYNAKVVAVDVGINTDKVLEGIIDKKISKGTNNMSKGPAMTREEAVRAIEVGIEMANKVIDEGAKVIGVGEMGICNTTPSSAIIAVVTGKEVTEVTGLGAGTLPEGLSNKIKVIEKAIKVNNPNKEDGIDILAKVGGFEIGGITGTILACASRRIPVVLDGFISYAGAIIAKLLNPLSMDYVIASHMSAEPASKTALDYLGLEAVLHMNMRLGEGSGAALMFSIIETSNKIYTNMLSFSDTVIPTIPQGK
ncbi:MAG: nicotinate-nucleotide--dimethylbenzimidazole phosphoribosyltransferase [Filifactoraceae bacterium]